MRGRRIILLTGVSASGKTTLQNKLLERGWERPINFTSRQPRDENALLSIDSDGDFTSAELEEYIFISNDNFLKKYKNGDFLEVTNYLGNRYGASRCLPNGNVCIILDPIGRSQALEYFTRIGIEVQTYYLEISKDTQKERLLTRGDSEKQILKRKRDFNWFSPTNKCIRLNGNKDLDELVGLIEKEI